jgi:hypothetical protein
MNVSEYKYNKFLPDFVRKDIDQEAAEWKEQFFNGLKNAIVDENTVDWPLVMSSIRIYHRYVDYYSIIRI